MPRKSLAALSIAPIIRAESPRLAAPAHLPAAERKLWRAIVAALPADWFRPETGPTLERYCVHVARARALEKLVAKVDPEHDLLRYERLVRLAGGETARVAALARSLRITNQSRIHPVTAGNRAARSVPVPTPDDDAHAVRQLVALRREGAR